MSRVIRIYDENHKFAGVMSAEAGETLSEILERYATKTCGWSSAKAMMTMFPIHLYAYTEVYYVTYGLGSQLAYCYSKVEVPVECDAHEYVNTLIGTNYAFIYDEAHWVVDGVSQVDRYNLGEVVLQPQTLKV